MEYNADMYNWKECGQRIATERENRGMSQNKLCKELGISRNSLSAIENGKQKPSFKTLFEICNQFECELGYLLCEFDGKTRDNTDIKKVIGLSEEAINLLKNGNKRYRKGTLFSTNHNQLSTIINFLLTNPHGMNLLQTFFDYINYSSTKINLFYKENKLTDDINIKSTETSNEYTFSITDIDNLLLLQIQKELIEARNDYKKV